MNDDGSNTSKLQSNSTTLKEFEEEYSRDNKEVRRQEKVKDSKDYYRGGFPGRYAARRLFGWSDGEYDRQYWQRLERNWRQWKQVKPAGGAKGRLTAVREVAEEEEGKIEEWNEEDEMGNIDDPMGEL